MVNFAKMLNEYLTLRRQLGFALANDEYTLENFVLYMKKKKSGHITAKTALEYATKTQCTPEWQRKKLGVVCKFASYVSAFDAKTEVPSPALLPHSYHRRPPYIFSDNEIINLLSACKTHLSKKPLLAQTYYAFFGLIAVTGMRSGEALALRCDSVNFENGIITIFESKFRKTRKIPIHPSAVKVLKGYSKFRDQCFEKKSSDYFFVNLRGQQLKSERTVFKNICSLVEVNKQGRFPPRLIDLRHTFAVRTLVNCYKTGDSVDAVIPILALYLGHENPRHTYWYLTAIPELMNLIGACLETKLGGKSV